MPCAVLDRYPALFALDKPACLICSFGSKDINDSLIKRSSFACSVEDNWKMNASNYYNFQIKPQ